MTLYIYFYIYPPCTIHIPTFKSAIFESIEIKSFEKTNALPFQMTPLKILYS